MRKAINGAMGLTLLFSVITALISLTLAPLTNVERRDCTERGGLVNGKTNSKSVGRMPLKD